MSSISNKSGNSERNIFLNSNFYKIQSIVHILQRFKSNIVDYGVTKNLKKKKTAYRAEVSRILFVVVQKLILFFMLKKKKRNNYIC